LLMAFSQMISSSSIPHYGTCSNTFSRNEIISEWNLDLMSFLESYFPNPANGYLGGSVIEDGNGWCPLLPRVLTVSRPKCLLPSSLTINQGVPMQSESSCQGPFNGPGDVSSF